MMLHEYLDKHCRNRTAFSRACGVCYNTINEFLVRGCDLHLSIAKKIVEATDNLVTLEELAAAVKPIASGLGSKPRQSKHEPTLATEKKETALVKKLTKKDKT